MAHISLAYDAVRAGFELRLGPASLESESVKIKVFGGLMAVRLGRDGHLLSVESSWAHGGVPLRGFNRVLDLPPGPFPITPPRFRVGPLQVLRDEQELALWFSSRGPLPRENWIGRHHLASGVTAWFSRRRVEDGRPAPGVASYAQSNAEGHRRFRMLAGLTVRFARAVAAYPVTSMRLAAEDFK